MKVTSTWLMTSAAQVLITFVVGAFMFINAAVITFYVFEGYQNYQKKQSMHVVETGRLHDFHSLEFTRDPNGTQRHCTALDTSSGRMLIRDGSGFCRQMMNNDWKRLAPSTNGVSTSEKLFWSAGFLLVFMAGAYLVGSIPANLVGLVLPGLAPFIKIIALLFTLPVLLFWAILVSSAWTYHPTYWTTPDGYTVDTQKVYITSDRRAFKAPETLWDWTSTQTMEEVRVFE